MIICGYNGITRNLEGIFVDENVPTGKGFIRGNPAEEDVLLKAGIEREDTLIIAVENDEKSIFITLIAKKLNPKIKIGVVVKRAETVGKAYKAGADYVVLESEMVGKEILRFLLSPRVAAFMDRIVLSEDLQILGMHLPDKYVGKKIKDTDIRKRIATIIAIKRGDKIIRNPKPGMVLKKGDILIFLLQGKEINKIREIMGQWILHRD
jgi:voltage-gated potassium channel